MTKIAALPTHGFFSVSEKCIMPMAFVLVLLHAIDVREANFHLLSTDLITGKLLLKDILAQGLYAAVLWLTFGSACHFIDSLRLNGISGFKNIPRVLLSRLKSRNASIAVGAILLQWLQLDYLVTMLARYSPYGPNIGLLSNIIGTLLVLTPPAALLLTTSADGADDFVRMAQKALPRLRCVAFLDGRTLTFKQKFDQQLENLRTFQFVEWEKEVRKMMDTVPIIIVDGRFSSGLVAEELAWIYESPARMTKVILILADTGLTNLTFKKGNSISSIRTCKLVNLKELIWLREKID